MSQTAAIPILKLSAEPRSLGQPMVEVREPPKHTVIIKYDMSRLLSITKAADMPGSFLVEPDSNPYNTTIVKVCIELHVTVPSQIDQISNAVHATTTPDTYSLELTQITPPLVYSKVIVYMPHTKTRLPGLHINGPNCPITFHDLRDSRFGDIRILASHDRCLVSSVRCRFLWIECTESYVRLYDAKASQSIDVLTCDRPILCSECRSRFIVFKTTKAKISANNVYARHFLQITTTQAAIDLNNISARSAEITTKNGDIMAEHVVALTLIITNYHAQVTGSIDVRKYMAVHAKRCQVSLQVKELSVTNPPPVYLQVPFGLLHLHLPIRRISFHEAFRNDGSREVTWINEIKS